MGALLLVKDSQVDEYPWLAQGACRGGHSCWCILVDLDMRVRWPQPPPSVHQHCGVSTTVRLQQISVGLEKAQGLQEGVKGAESPGFQPRILLSLANTLLGCLSLPLRGSELPFLHLFWAADPQIFPKDSLGQKNGEQDPFRGACIFIYYDHFFPSLRSLPEPFHFPDSSVIKWRKFPSLSSVKTQ